MLKIANKYKPYIKESNFFHSILILIFITFSFWAVKLGVLFSGFLPFVILIIPLILIALGYKFDTSDLPKAFKILHLTILVQFCIYIHTAHYSISKDIYPSLSVVDIFLTSSYTKYIILFVGVIGVFRPAFGLLPLFYVLYEKTLFEQIIGIRISPTDYKIVLEFGIYLLLGFIVISRLKGSNILSKAESGTATLEKPLYLLIFFAIAGHFGNYFYSAIDKMLLDNNIFTWAIENRTNYLTMVADISKNLFLDFGDDFKTDLHIFLSKIVPLVNWSTLILQFISIIALYKIRLAIIVTIMYDIMHVTIFLLTGIFFWKWIILNLAIVSALATLAKNKVSLKVFCSSLVFVIISPFFFSTAYLGWFDTASLDRGYFFAVTKDGDKYKVPSNYFLLFSISDAQNVYIGSPFFGHYKMSPFGNIEDPDKQRMYLANRCELPLADKSGVDESNPQYEEVKRFIQNHHKYILQNVNEDGKYMYDIYPHHIWSNPFRFKEFYNLDKRNIIAYDFVVESGCLNFDGKKVNYDVKLRGGYTIGVAGIK